MYIIVCDPYGTVLFQLRQARCASQYISDVDGKD